jgi:hypothetical protein
MMGKVRAIVGRYFRGAGSRFNVTTPTAIIGVRGTHFIVDATRVDETTVVCVDSARDLSVRNIQEDVGGEVALTSGLMTRILERQPPTPPAPVPDDQMMQLLMDTRVILPTLHGGPVEMRGLLRRRAAAAGPEVVGGGKIPPIPEAPDQPLFTPLRIPRFPPPPPPPPN